MRNRWIITAVALMTGFGLILDFAGSAPAGTLGVDRLTITVSSLATLSVYLVPLIALLLSCDAFAGEAERGTLPLLLTYPVARREILVGKFGAQLLVLAAAILIGFGLTAVAVWASGGASAESLRHLFRLVWSAIVLGAVFLALGNCLSPCIRQAGTAAPGERKATARTVRLNNRALATSEPLGTTFDTAGRFGHILDPRTGRPAAMVRQVSVMAPSAAIADALSTTFCLMADDKVLKVLETFADTRIVHAL